MPPPPSRHLLRARDLADRAFPDRLTVAHLAREAGLSPAHFSRSYRAAFGESPHQYLLTRRLERAAFLLRTTDQPVTSVALAVGWASLGSFTASFRRIYGVPPTVWRASGRPAGDAAEARVPGCVLRTLARPRNRRFREAPAADLP